MKQTFILFNLNNSNRNNFINVRSLPKELNSVLIGIMLGDGSIYRTSLTRNARFEMSFGQKYKNFAESLGILFKDYMNNPVKIIEIKGKNKVYQNFRLKTISLPLFNQYHDMFYKYDSNLDKYVKIVPENILEFLDPIVLSYLIMTDGNFDKSRNRVRIYTNSYKKEEVQILANAINTKFGIYVGVLHDRKNQ
jgi:LAGLIDADG DNA endonuclease family